MLAVFGGNAMITVAILSLLALTIATASVMARKRNRAASDQAGIPLFKMASASPIPRPFADIANRPSSFDSGAHTPLHGDSLDRQMGYSHGAPTVRSRDGAISTLPRAHRADAPVAASEDSAGEAVDGESVRYWRAADGTLQFLPGRLVIAGGRDTGHEIRFVRTSGPAGTLVTFGRAEGAPYRHVQLREPTVSRVHARMELEQPPSPNGFSSKGITGGPPPPRWRLDNLSSTNPVIVNGRPLDAEGTNGASVMLSDGDRIEMGEVAFVFHGR
jgi:hypothetical protein